MTTHTYLITLISLNCRIVRRVVAHSAAAALLTGIRMMPEPGEPCAITCKLAENFS